jgi:hypothetical protein
MVLLASVAASGPRQAAKASPGSGATEDSRLPGWMRIGNDAGGAIRPQVTMEDNVEGASHPAHHCSIATIAGQWVWRYSARTDTGLDVGGVGTLTIESNGNDSFHGWFTIGPDVLESTATGTISVDPDCTGTQTWFGEPPGVYKVAIQCGGREIGFQSQPPNGSDLRLPTGSIVNARELTGRSQNPGTDGTFPCFPKPSPSEESVNVQCIHSFATRNVRMSEGRSQNIRPVSK